MDSEKDPQLEGLLQYVRAVRGFDFTGYKRPTLSRRVTRRLQILGMGGYAEYQDYLEVHPDEFEFLFNSVLINVTSFFRDAEMWDLLRDEIVPSILAQRTDGEPIRIWSAGCASGEEPHSLAMLFAEAMGEGAFLDRVKIYATDIDEEALSQARRATYPEQRMADVPADLREKYFVRNGAHSQVRAEFRRNVIFGNLDLLQHAPISRLDLLMCRNTLMYFNSEAQSRVVSRFHFALHDDGYLVLGRAETLLGSGNLFKPVSLRHRVFGKVMRRLAPERLLALNDDVTPQRSDLHMMATQLMYQHGASPEIVFDIHGTLVMVNSKASAQFGLRRDDLGRTLESLPVADAPVDLRVLFAQAVATRRPIVIPAVEHRTTFDELQYFEVRVVPLISNNRTIVGVSVSYQEVTTQQGVREELLKTRHALDSARTALQTASEELETHREELQSTVEELETTNEELQSSNEELETTNEELQASNEELRTINDELRERSDDLDRLSAFFKSVLASLGGGVIVVGQDLRIIAWNPVAEDMWGLRAEEVEGRNLASLQFGLDVGPLVTLAHGILNGDRQHNEVVMHAMNRRGRRFRCHVTATPLIWQEDERLGVVYMLEEVTGMLVEMDEVEPAPGEPQSSA